MKDEEFKQLVKEIQKSSDKFWWPSADTTFCSIRKALHQHFKMDATSLYASSKKNGKLLELEIFGYNNTAVYVVEVKSHLKEDGLQQMLDILREFPEFFVEHADKKLYGILAAVNIPDNLRIKVLKSGIYLANIRDEHFELQVPENFQAKDFAQLNVN